MGQVVLGQIVLGPVFFERVVRFPFKILFILDSYVIDNLTEQKIIFWILGILRIEVILLG